MRRAALSSVLLALAALASADSRLIGVPLTMDVVRNGVSLPVDRVPRLQAGDHLHVRPRFPADGQWQMVTVFVQSGGTIGKDAVSIRKLDVPAREEDDPVVPADDAEPVILFVPDPNGGPTKRVSQLVQSDPNSTLIQPAQAYEATLDQKRYLDTLLEGLATADITPERKATLLQMMEAAYGNTAERTPTASTSSDVAAALQAVSLARQNGLPTTDAATFAISAFSPPGMAIYAKIVTSLSGIFRRPTKKETFNFTNTAPVAEGLGYRMDIPAIGKPNGKRPVFVVWPHRPAAGRFTPPVALKAPTYRAPSAGLVGASPTWLLYTGATFETADPTVDLTLDPLARNWRLEVAGWTIPLTADTKSGKLVVPISTAFDTLKPGVTYPAKVCVDEGFDRVELANVRVGVPRPLEWKVSGDSAFHLEQTATTPYVDLKPSLDAGALPPSIEAVALKGDEGGLWNANSIEARDDGTFRVWFPAFPAATYPKAKIRVTQTGVANPDVGPEVAILAPMPKAAAIEYHPGDDYVALSGAGTDAVTKLIFGGTNLQVDGTPTNGVTRFVPAPGQKAIGGVPTHDRATAVLGDGRSFLVDFDVRAPRPLAEASVRVIGRDGMPYGVDPTTVAYRGASLMFVVHTKGATFDNTTKIQVRRRVPSGAPIDAAVSEIAAKDLVIDADFRTARVTVPATALFDAAVNGEFEFRLVQRDAEGPWQPLQTEEGKDLVMVRLPEITEISMVDGKTVLKGTMLDDVREFRDPSDPNRTLPSALKATAGGNVLEVNGELKGKIPVLLIGLPTPVMLDLDAVPKKG